MFTGVRDQRLGWVLGLGAVLGGQGSGLVVIGPPQYTLAPLIGGQRSVWVWDASDSVHPMIGRVDAAVVLADPVQRFDRVVLIAEEPDEFSGNHAHAFGLHVVLRHVCWVAVNLCEVEGRRVVLHVLQTILDQEPGPVASLELLHLVVQHLYEPIDALGAERLAVGLFGLGVRLEGDLVCEGHVELEVGTGRGEIALALGGDDPQGHVDLLLEVDCLRVVLEPPEDGAFRFC